MNKKLFILPNTTILEAMKRLSDVGERCLVVTNENNKLLGTISDGDIRKAILKGSGVRNSIDSWYYKRTTFLIKGEYSLAKAKEIFLKNKFDLIPVVDKNKIVTEILFYDSIHEKNFNHFQNNLQVPVIIMAGGKGTRLEPFTKVLPKPLIPLGEKTVIEHIIEKFTRVGCNEFFITIHYKARIIKAYFEELKPEYRIEFIQEKKPYGTAGSLSLLPKSFEKPFIVTNCDIMVSTDLTDLYSFHLEGEYGITLVASTQEHIIPYGTCELNYEGHLSRLNEKPKFDLLINTGLYVLNPEILEMIPEKKQFDITDLIDNLINNSKKIGVFPINESSWIDVGQWAEYEKAVKSFSNHKQEII